MAPGAPLRRTQLALLCATVVCTYTAAAVPSAEAYPCCTPLGVALRLHWRVPNATDGTLEFALAGAVSEDAWMAWGPAARGAVNRLMGGADAVAGGWDASAGAPWAADFFLESYAPCDVDATPPTGVCSDAALSAGSSDDVTLLAGSRAGGVTTLLLRRPLAARDAAHDVALQVDAAASYVWATGPLRAAANAPALRLAQHGASADAYGTLPQLQLSTCPSACGPLTAGAPPAPPAPRGFSGPLALAGGGVTLSWRLHDGGVTFAVRTARAAGWASVAIGHGMVGSHAYVAWRDAAGVWRVDSYAMTSLAASGLTRVTEPALQNVTVSADGDGIISFSFFRPLASSGGGAPALDAAAAPLLWALGDVWGDALTSATQHFTRSSVPTLLNLLTGAASEGAPPPLPAALRAHGVLMALACAALMPATAAAARYLRCGSGSAWLAMHRGLALAALLTAAAGLAAALASQQALTASVALRGTHGRVGVAALVLLAAQPLGAALRPPAAPRDLARAAWEAAHRAGAAAALAVAFAALFTGIAAAQSRGLSAPVAADLTRALAVWLGGLGAYALAREVAAARARRHPAKALLKHSDAEDGGELADDADARRISRRHAAARRSAWAGAAWLALLTVLVALLAACRLGGASTQQPRVLSLAPAPTVAPAPPLAAPPQAGGATPAAAGPLPGCALTLPFELARLGDGWCDAGVPYNTAACGWDGGDCCDVGASLYECADPSSPRFGAASPRGLRFPAPHNPRYDAGPGRQLSTQGLAQTYNNFYEFTYDKNVAPLVTSAATAAMSLASPAFGGWRVRVDGAVAAPMDLHARDLAALFHMERRVYRHRCVEAWSIVVPWEGFPLRKLLAAVQPLPSARWLRFESFVNPSAARNQASSPGGLMGAPWPYVEALTIEEAWNDLTFIALGQYNATLPPQSGGPLRLTVPWKYGFKSIKSITRITVLDESAERPVNWWQRIAPAEYGFYACVNPAYRHPRWSQASEAALVDAPSGQARVPTQIFNGYGEEVAHMYGTTREFFF